MFSWSNSGGKQRRPSSSTYPANRTSVAQPVSGSIRPPTYTRQQHLDSYLEDATLKPSTRRVSRDDTTYDTVFQTTAGNALILRVRVPPAAINSSNCRAPAMTLVGVRASHPLINSRMSVVNYEPIQSDHAWQSSGVLLGKAVNAVVRQLQLEPPQIMEISDPGLERIQQSLPGNNTRNNSAARGRHAQLQQHPDTAPPDYDSLVNQSIPEIHLPDIPTSFPELDGMDRDELQRVLDDELEFLSLLHRLDAYKQIQQKSQNILQENAGVARANLEKQEEYTQLYKNVTAKKSQLQQEVEVFRGLEKLQNQKCAPPNVANVLSELQKSKKEALEESEQLASEWVEDGGDIDDFFDKFLQRRCIHHQRAAKVERLKQANIK